MRNNLTAERVREIIDYNPETGIFIRRINSAKGKTRAGDVAGHIESNGYLALWVLGTKYLAHRIAWLYMTGAWPVDQIDHINRDRSDNRFENLREVNNAENQQNRSIRRDCASGFMGVRKNKSRWMAEIRADKVRFHLGTYDTPEEASAAYLEAKKRLHRGAA